MPQYPTAIVEGMMKHFAFKPIIDLEFLSPTPFTLPEVNSGKHYIEFVTRKESKMIQLPLDQPPGLTPKVTLDDYKGFFVNGVSNFSASHIGEKWVLSFNNLCLYHAKTRQWLSLKATLQHSEDMIFIRKGIPTKFIQAETLETILAEERTVLEAKIVQQGAEIDQLTQLVASLRVQIADADNDEDKKRKRP